MGLVHQDIPEELLSNFNDKARKKFGDKKGCKRAALIEAIQAWVKEPKEIKRNKR